MTHVRVSSDATDAKIQRRLNQLYSKKDNQDNKQVAMKYVLPEHTEQKCTVLEFPRAQFQLIQRCVNK